MKWCYSMKWKWKCLKVEQINDHLFVDSCNSDESMNDIDDEW